jgi:hypothetical protein
MTNVPDDPREAFEYFSQEYAQALQAYQTLEAQAGTLLLMGHTEELLQFLSRFMEMATRVGSLAAARDEQNFAEWFGELVKKAEALRATVPQD